MGVGVGVGVGASATRSVGLVVDGEGAVAGAGSSPQPVSSASSTIAAQSRVGMSEVCPRRQGRAITTESAGAIISLVSVDVTVQTTIQRPPEVVAAFAGDPTNVTEWYANIRSVEWQTLPPVAVGSRMDFVAHFLGKRLAYTYEVVELEAERRLVMRTADGPFPMETTYTWEPAGVGATTMSLRNVGEPSGFSRVAAPVMELAMKRATTKDLARLKALLETDDAAG